MGKLSPIYSFVQWVIFQAFLSFADFFKVNFFRKNSFRNTIRVSNSFDPGQALGPNCLQRLSADDTSIQRVNNTIFASLIINRL